MRPNNHAALAQLVLALKARTQRLELKAIRSVILEPGEQSGWYPMDISYPGTYSLQITATRSDADGFLAGLEDLKILAKWYAPTPERLHQELQKPEPYDPRRRFEIASPAGRYAPTGPLMQVKLMNGASHAGQFTLHGAR